MINAEYVHGVNKRFEKIEQRFAELEKKAANTATAIHVTLDSKEVAKVIHDAIKGMTRRDAIELLENISRDILLTTPFTEGLDKVLN